MKQTSKRWRVIIRYHSDAGLVDVEHWLEELDELAEAVERGPNWYAMKDIVIMHNRKESETMTLEQAAAE